MSYSPSQIIPSSSTTTTATPHTTNPTTTTTPSTPYLSYLLIAFFDVQANYLTVLAFQYTTFNSITLFSSLAVPSSMIWSKILLQRKFTVKHVIAALVCIGGVFINVYGDIRQEEEEEKEGGGDDGGNGTIAPAAPALEYNDTTTTTITDIYNNNNENDATTTTNKRSMQQQFIGDLSAICGGILYGLNDVLAEKIVKYHNGCIEYLSYMGLFGTIVSIVQVLLVERMDVYNLLFSKREEEGEEEEEEECPTSQIGIFLMLFVITNVCFYGGSSYFLIVSSAPMLNLSFLTADFWSVVFVVVEEHFVPDVLFWVALVLIVCGVCLYEMSPSSSSLEVAVMDGD
eukprot:CAMPEP_0185726242 /NCGR_PEP_ID=MMETSP1171-20130828/2285_1 /TAXON_ID=374046 /ORGANISM="Helicotheca tamensis, Strain CCMP826" /LENGTH=342 /DNA_ID=CAMNT_0028394557 /DNA_START=95 /DNA_END=1120 /DNA_ORIENTATION=+